jgi:hypothetical protein
VIIPTAARYGAKLCVSFFLVMSAPQVADVTGVTGVTDVTTCAADFGVPTRPTRRDQQKFLILRLSRAGRQRCQTRAPKGAAPPRRSKPLIRRHIDGTKPAGGGAARGIWACQGRGAALYTLDFWPRNQGVGLAFVSQRGYGRRRWLVLYQSRHERRRKPWPFPS